MYFDSKNKVGLENKTEKTFSPQGFALNEKNIEKKSSKLVEFKKSELAKQMEEAFPDAKLEDIQEKNND